MQVIPYQEHHLLQMDVQPKQSAIQNMKYAKGFKELAGTVSVDEDGDILAIGGVFEFIEGRHLAWCVLSSNLGKKMIPLHRIAKRYLAAYNNKRVEAVVECGFVEGYRLAELLGFEHECFARKIVRGERDGEVFVRLGGE